MTARERRGRGGGRRSSRTKPRRAGGAGQVDVLFSTREGGHSRQKATAERAAPTVAGSWLRGRLWLQPNVAVATGGLTPTRPPAARSQRAASFPEAAGGSGECGSPQQGGHRPQGGSLPPGTHPSPRAGWPQKTGWGALCSKGPSPGRRRPGRAERRPGAGTGQDSSPASGRKWWPSVAEDTPGHTLDSLQGATLQPSSVPVPPSTLCSRMTVTGRPYIKSRDLCINGFWHI